MTNDTTGSGRILESSPELPCPICKRNEQDCGIYEDLITVLCHTAAHKTSKWVVNFPPGEFPPKEINGYRYKQISTKGELRRAVYVKTNAKKPAKADPNEKPIRETHYIYNRPDGSAIARVCRNDYANQPKKIWQEYWIDDPRLDDLFGEGCDHRYITLGKAKIGGEKHRIGSFKKGDKVTITKEHKEAYKAVSEQLMKELRLYGLHHPANIRALEPRGQTSPSKYFFIAEGEAIVDILTGLNIPAFSAIGGAEKWLDYGGACGNYREDLKLWIDAGRIPVICPDCDIPGIKHAADIAKDLEAAGAKEIKWLYADPTNELWSRLPELTDKDAGKGFDLKDALKPHLEANKGPLDVLELLGGWIEDKPREFDLPGPSGDDLPLFDLSDELASEADIDIYKLDPTIAGTSDHHISIYLFKQGKGDICTINEAFYQYKDGIWHLLSDSRIRRQVSEFLAKMYRWKKVVNDDGEEDFVKVYPFANAANCGSAIKFARGLLAVSQDQLDNNHLIAFENCVLNLKTKECLEHSKDYYLTTQISTQYKAGCSLPEAFRHYIDTCFGEDKIEFVRAVLRYYLDPSMPYEKFVHIIGKSGSGKGIFIRFLAGIHGKHYQAITNFSALNTAENRQQILSGKRLIAIPDLHGTLGDLGAFYELVSNGQMSGRVLYSSEMESIRWNCRFILGSTKPAMFDSSNTGWDRRAVLLLTKPRQGLQDPKLEASIQDCKAEVISWAMDMDPEVAYDFLNNTEKLISGVSDMKDLQQIQSDNVAAFVDACLRPANEPSIVIEKETLFKRYAAFCSAKNYKAKNENNFMNSLKDILPQEFAPIRKSFRLSASRSDVRKFMVVPGVELADPEMFVARRPDDPHSDVDMKKPGAYGGLALFRERAEQLNQARKNLADRVADPVEEPVQIPPSKVESNGHNTAPELELILQGIEGEREF